MDPDAQAGELNRGAGNGPFALCLPRLCESALFDSVQSVQERAAAIEGENDHGPRPSKEWLGPSKPLSGSLRSHQAEHPADERLVIPAEGSMDDDFDVFHGGHNDQRKP